MPMKYCTVFITCLIILTASPVPATAQTTSLPDIDKYFAVAFEQNGQLVPIEDHQVTLQKKTFSIVLYFKEPGSVLVNSALQPESFEQARDGVPFERIRGFADLGMAEEPFNPKTLLMPVESSSALLVLRTRHQPSIQRCQTPKWDSHLPPDYCAGYVSRRRPGHGSGQGYAGKRDLFRVYANHVETGFQPTIRAAAGVR